MKFRIYLVTIFLSILAVGVYAADLTSTPFTYKSGDTGVLRAGVTSSSTSLTLEPIKKWVNGAQTTGCWGTGSGFIIVEDYGGIYEYMSFNGVSCSSNNFSTLSNLRRGLDPTNPSFTAGTGTEFDAGATVRLIDFPVIYLNTVYTDRINTFSGSGRLTSDQTRQALLNLPCVTTAQRDLFTITEEGDVICNSTLGVFQYRSGSAWINFGSGSTVNATESVAGKVQLASTGAMVNHRITGSTGAAEVLYSSYVTGTGGTINRWRIPLLGRLGTLSGSLLGQNCPGGTGTYLNGLGRCTTLSAADLTQAPAGSGTNLVFSAIYGSTITNTAGGIFEDIDASLNGTVNVSVGDTIMATLRMSVVDAASGGDGYFDIRVGGGRIGRLENPSTSGSGGLLQVHVLAADTTKTDRPVSITVFHRVQTGSTTLSVAPQWKSRDLAGGGSFLRSNGEPPIYFQVMVIKNI